jgi:uncharacterized protein
MWATTGDDRIMSTPASGDMPTVDTVINVAQLLKQAVGATRRYAIDIDELALDDEHRAHNIRGQLRLTRMGSGLLAQGSASGQVELVCVRCLDTYTADVEVTLEDEFRPTIDITSGAGLDQRSDRPGEVDFFLLTENHELDLAEPLRQAFWLAVPMMPICRTDCAGIPLDDTAAGPAEDEAGAAAVDERLAVLQRLLEESDGEQRRR